MVRMLLANFLADTARARAVTLEVGGADGAPPRIAERVVGGRMFHVGHRPPG